ncbi:MAG: thiamine pyrophosphate-dependent enzyme, partial [Opitutaceae bacterium]
RAEGYTMAWDVCNGHDIYEVREKTEKFLALAREKSRPSILEIKTYRYRGHSVSDPDSTYREKAEIEEYRRTKDPIQLFQNTLVAERVLDDALIETVDHEAKAEAENAAAFADASPYPTVADITKDVYWEEDNPAQKKSQGRIFFD